MDAEGAWKKAAKCANKVAKLDRQIERSYATQEKIRRYTGRALHGFSAWFDYVVRAVLGDDMASKVEFAGRDIALKVEYHGERRSTAIKIIKILAFDLAALVNSVEGRGYHPRFLIHDGPREADMSPDVYRRFFLFVRELEKCFADGHEPSFQYIVTTTEPAPDELLKSPWLLEPVLDASDPAKRLLGVDL
jgi:hypothetical protein